MIALHLKSRSPPVEILMPRAPATRPSRWILEDPSYLDLIHEGYVPLQDLILERPYQFQARPISYVAEPAIRVGAEGSLHYLPVGSPVEERPVLLELVHPFDNLLRVDLDHPPVAKALALDDGIRKVHLPAVARVDVPEGRRDSSLGHHRVSLPHQDLRYYERARATVEGLDRGPETGAARADNQHIARNRLVGGVVDRDFTDVRILGPQLRMAQPWANSRATRISVMSAIPLRSRPDSPTRRVVEHVVTSQSIYALQKSSVVYGSR